MTRLWVMSFAAFIACDSRPALVAVPEAGRSDTRSPDGGRRDGSFRGDLPPRYDGHGEPFCSSEPRAMVDGTLLTVSEVKTGTTLTECCDGEFLRFVTTDPAGKPVQIEVSLLRFPSAALVNYLDLGQLPSRWTMGVNCDPYEACGNHDTGSSTFEGYAHLEPSNAAPEYRLTLCLSATPKATRTLARPVRLWASGVAVHTSCTFGVNQTCNADWSAWSIKGTCNEDGTCTCHPGAVKVLPSGKCQ
jgi:hypothetical protein